MSLCNFGSADNDLFEATYWAHSDRNGVVLRRMLDHQQGAMTRPISEVTILRGRMLRLSWHNSFQTVGEAWLLDGVTGRLPGLVVSVAVPQSDGVIGTESG
jgi:hypothetical protein